eukprot:scaffold32195_cov122-Isochrysis_galbana.AAC.7
MWPWLQFCGAYPVVAAEVRALFASSFAALQALHASSSFLHCLDRGLFLSECYYDLKGTRHWGGLLSAIAFSD